MTLDILKSDADWIAHYDSVISKKSELSPKQLDLDNSSPQDLKDSGFSAIESEVKTELLERLKDIDPYYFEKVILIRWLKKPINISADGF